MIKNNHDECSFSKWFKFMISEGRMRCPKVRQILRYQVPNKHFSPESFAHHVLFLIYSFKNGKKLLSGLLPMYQNELEEWIQDVVKHKYNKIWAYHDLVDQPFSQFKENLINNQDPHNQIENLQYPTLCQKCYQMMRSQNV